MLNKCKLLLFLLLRRHLPALARWTRGLERRRIKADITAYAKAGGHRKPGAFGKVETFN